MKTNIRPYLAMFRMRLIAGMQYRAAAWAGVATQFFWGFMQIMIFLAFYRSSSAPPPMTVTEMSSYIWLQQAFLAIIMLWSQDNELLKQIADGNIAYELCRPYDLFSFWYARLIAQRLSNAALRCLPILIVAALLPAPYNMTLPAGGAAGGLFVLAMAFAVLLVVAISMFIYILTFVTLSPVGARLIVGVTAEFFMGAIIPIPMMPGKLQKVLNFLPFRYTSDLPFRIYSGNIAGADALRQIGIQVIWTACLLALGAWAFRRVTRRIVVQGG